VEEDGEEREEGEEEKELGSKKDQELDKGVCIRVYVECSRKSRSWLESTEN
jgi:hypothetical protein